jgi:peptidoglycan/LPS O-acetylase OafA/YrhL
VQFFFVLSGFLITHLLLAARSRVDSGGSTFALESRRFFFRRSLRLWPVYYAVIIGACLLHIPYARDTFWWHATFLTNHYIGQTGIWPQLLSHFWTLAVEQQFYLVWPWLLLGLPRKLLPWLMGGLVIMGPLMRAQGVSFGLAPEIAANLYLPACVDYFAFGAFIALWRGRTGATSEPLGRRAIQVAAVGIVALVTIFHLKTGQASPRWRDAWSGTVGAITFGAVVVHCLADGDSWLRRFLRWRVFVYLGTISYGIYIYHNFAHWLGPRILRRLWGQAYFTVETAHVLYLIALSLIMAAVSWHVLEQPINRFRTRKTAPASATQS